MDLSIRQQRFAEQYIIDFNGQRSAEAAGYSSSSARAQASRMLTNNNVRKKILELTTARSERTKVTQDMVIAQLAAIAFANIGDFMSWTGGTVEVLSRDQIDPHKLAAIESLNIDVGKEGNASHLKLRDSLRALELLCRHLGMFDGSASNSKDNTEAQTNRLFEAVGRFTERMKSKG